MSLADGVIHLRLLDVVHRPSFLCSVVVRIYMTWSMDQLQENGLKRSSDLTKEDPGSWNDFKFSMKLGGMIINSEWEGS
jgi:hypothetical protein